MSVHVAYSGQPIWLRRFTLRMAASVIEATGLRTPWLGKTGRIGCYGWLLRFLRDELRSAMNASELRLIIQRDFSDIWRKPRICTHGGDRLRADFRIQQLIFQLSKIFERFYLRAATTSVDVNRRATGAFVRFCHKTLELLGYSFSPNAVRKRIERIKNLGKQAPDKKGIQGKLEMAL